MVLELAKRFDNSVKKNNFICWIVVVFLRQFSGKEYVVKQVRDRFWTHFFLEIQSAGLIE